MDASPPATYLRVTSVADLDGDGLPDDGIVKLVCADDQLQQAFFVAAPRDGASAWRPANACTSQ